MTNGDRKPHVTTPSWQQAREEGARRIDARDYEGAVTILQRAIQGDPTGESHALLGLAQYHLEQYTQAAAHYESALEQEPDNDGWRRMRTYAAYNAVS